MANRYIESNSGYPLYMHNNNEFINYWKTYWDKHPLATDERVQLYIHYPFCRSLCKFCVYGSNLIKDFKDTIPVYENAVLDIIKSSTDIIPNKINNVYFGGGTPSLWNKDILQEVVDSIPGYYDANIRTIETHHLDLTYDWIEFCMKDIGINTISIGIQSFDRASNISQNRAPVDVYNLKRSVELIHSMGGYVNIDIISLYDKPDSWDLFIKDLNILGEIIRPDDICSNVNFHMGNYYSHVPKHREILSDFISRHPEYQLEHPDSLSLDMESIIAYEEEPYHLRLNDYASFLETCDRGYLDRDITGITKNIVMGFGGTPEHAAISRVGHNIEDIRSSFDFNKNVFTHKISKARVIPSYQSGNSIPQIQIGKCTIDTNLK